jgi:hypothetical protein
MDSDVYLKYLVLTQKKYGTDWEIEIEIEKYPRFSLTALNE